MDARKPVWEIAYCSACGGTGESWNPIVGVFDGQCRSCRGRGEVKVRAAAVDEGQPQDGRG